MVKLSRYKKEEPAAKSHAPTNGKTKTPAATAPASVRINFPTNDEKIGPQHYAVRMTSVGAGFVEISVNKGAWEPCRPAVGYLWFDWYPSQIGKQTLVSRLTTIAGKTVQSDTVVCEVVGSKAGKGKK